MNQSKLKKFLIFISDNTNVVLNNKYLFGNITTLLKNHGASKALSINGLIELWNYLSSIFLKIFLPVLLLKTSTQITLINL